MPSGLKLLHSFHGLAQSGAFALLGRPVSHPPRAFVPAGFRRLRVLAASRARYPLGLDPLPDHACRRGVGRVEAGAGLCRTAIYYSDNVIVWGNACIAGDRYLHGRFPGRARGSYVIGGNRVNVRHTMKRFAPLQRLKLQSRYAISGHLTDGVRAP
jgi:hypothetical protein